MMRLQPIRLAFAVFVGAIVATAAPAAASAAEPIAEAGFHIHWAEQAFSAAPASPPSAVPFSFVYGGRRSSELLGKWKRTVTEEPAAGGKQRRILTLTDPETGLEVRAVATVYTDTPSVEWTLYFTNKGEKDTPILEQVRAVDATVKSGVSTGVKLLRLVGSPCRVDDWLPFENVMKPGEPIAFAPVGGRSSSDASPFFNLQWPGGGVITAIGWSGQWAANVECSKDGRLNVSAGIQTMHLKLHPGETIRSPRIMQLYWSGDDPWRGYNQFRRVMFAHVMPRIDGQLVVPPIVHLSTSFYELNNSTEANVLSHLEAAKGLGFEVFLARRLLDQGRFPGWGRQLWISDQTRRAAWIVFLAVCGRSATPPTRPA